MQAQVNVLKMGSTTNKTMNTQAIVFPFTQNIETTIPGKTNYFNFLAPGLMIMIVMITVMTGIPEAISKENEMGTFDGILSAPINQVSIILGYTASLCVKGFAQCILVLVIAIIFFGVTISRKHNIGIFPATIGYFYRHWNTSCCCINRSSYRYYNCEFDNVSHDVSCGYILSHTTDAMVYARYLK